MFDFEKISLEQLERAMQQEKEEKNEYRGGERGTYKSVIKQGHIKQLENEKKEEGSLR